MTHSTYTYRIIIILLSLMLCPRLHGRSILRPPDPTLPQLSVQWLDADAASCVTIKDSHFEEYPIFSFTIDGMRRYMLPSGPIIFHNDQTKSVTGDHLRALIEEVLQEILQQKTTFAHFKVLQTKNFSTKLACGLIVLKFNDYPFVLKLFMENPVTFGCPYGKGIEPVCFFYMAGGANRHITGLTRIPNAEYIKKKLATMPQWEGLVEIPRKWLWLPQKTEWLLITGDNIGDKGHVQTKIPAIYGIIADAIDMHQQIDVPKREKKDLVIQLCNDLDLYLDPHYKNFTFLPAQTEKEFKIVVVDTEHFATIIGLRYKKNFKNHNQCYMHLGAKYFKDAFLRTKKERRFAQTRPHPLALSEYQ